MTENRPEYKNELTTDHDPDVVRMLQSIAANKRECEGLRGDILQLKTDLANERTTRKILDDTCHRIGTERDFYMRLAVQLRTQLNDAAALLQKDIEEANAISFIHTELPRAASSPPMQLSQLADAIDGLSGAGQSVQGRKRTADRPIMGTLPGGPIPRQTDTEDDRSARGNGDGRRRTDQG